MEREIALLWCNCQNIFYRGFVQLENKAILFYVALDFMFMFDFMLWNVSI